MSDGPGAARCATPYRIPSVLTSHPHGPIYKSNGEVSGFKMAKGSFSSGSPIYSDCDDVCGRFLT